MGEKGKGTTGPIGTVTDDDLILDRSLAPEGPIETTERDGDDGGSDGTRTDPGGEKGNT